MSAVRIITADCQGVCVSACVRARVWASVYVLAGAHVGVYVNAAVRQLNACALLRAWHQGKMKRPGE